jgi:hypothetical protein
VVDDGEGLLRGVDFAAGHAEAFEGLGARDLVDEVAVNIEEAGAIRLAVDDMVVKNLIVQGLRGVIGHGARETFRNGVEDVAA